MSLSTTIKITMTSSISEADLYAHFRAFVEEIKQMKDKSWWTNCATDWEESHPVEIEMDTIEEIH
jgi:hypothetical protein